MYAYIIFLSFYGHMGFSLLAARSGVYIQVPYSADTPVPLFDPFLEFTTTLVGVRCEDISELGEPAVQLKSVIVPYS